MRRARRVAPLLALALCAPGIAADAADAGEDHVGQELARAKPPWYDAERDDWRRVEVREPAPPKPSSSSSSSPRNAGMLAEVVAYSLAATALVLLGWLVWLALRAGRGLVIEQRQAEAAPLRRADISALPFLPREGQGDPEGALATALKRRDWALAAIWLYTLMLLRLDRAGALRLAPGKTNGVYRSEARRAAPAAAPALEDGIALFERSYFGHLPVSEQDVRALAERRRALESAVAPEGAP